MVHLTGRTTVRSVGTLKMKSSGGSSGGGSMHSTTIIMADERPPDPASLLLQSPGLLEENVEKLLDWFQDKNSVLCITGAGLSTESGIRDYRGHHGSYHNGHVPMVHDQFISSEAQRKRYWGRGMVGWRDFDTKQPNSGHYALAQLEKMGKIGVQFPDQLNYYRPENAMDFTISSGMQHVSIITQNVDSLHKRAGSKYVTELHGRTDRLKCMNCGSYRPRNEFHDELEYLNKSWLEDVLAEQQQQRDGNMRPDGDAYVARSTYDDVIVPPCTKCGGFLKPDVVFFGDSVPRHRVERCYAAVNAADGLLCVGTSLAVHSAFRFVRAAAEGGVPIAVLNVGETRAETSNLDVMKIESPAGPTLSALCENLTVSPSQSEEKRVMEI